MNNKGLGSLVSRLILLGLIVTSCGGGDQQPQGVVPPSGTPSAQTNLGPSSGLDFFFLATVPDQVVTSNVFEVEAIAESVSGQAVPAPTVVDHNGNVVTMNPKQLNWPGTSEPSILVYAASVALVSNQDNNLKVVFAGREIPFMIRHRSAHDVRVATTTLDLANLIKTAISSPDIDVVEADFDVSDLGSVLDSLGGGIVNQRVTWLTLRPAAGRSMQWNRDSGTPTRRPKIDRLKIHGAVFGGDASDGGGGDYYTEVKHRVWINASEFRAKYKTTWPKTQKLTAIFRQDIRAFAEEEQKIYFTDCLFHGTAANVAISSAELARDLRFVSHRGDFNNFGRVFMNVLASDISPIRNFLDTDYLHNDGFQIWGPTSDLVFKGFRVISPTVSAELQPFLLSRTFSPDYRRVLIDTVKIEGAANTSLKGQLSGRITDARISNLSFPAQGFAIRRDFTEPNGAFAPFNVFISDAHVRDVEYLDAGGSVTLKASNVPDPMDVSPQLNAMPGLEGATFSRVRVAP